MWPFPTSGVQVHAGYFCVSIIYQTLTAWSLMCIHGLSYACVYTWGLGTLIASQRNVFDSEKLNVFLVLLRGFEPSTFGFPVQHSNHWANPSPQCMYDCGLWVFVCIRAKENRPMLLPFWSSFTGSLLNAASSIKLPCLVCFQAFQEFSPTHLVHCNI